MIFGKLLIKSPKCWWYLYFNHY